MPANNKSQRITVTGRNLKFLKTLAEQMDETNLTEVLSYLLTDVRCLGYAIGNKPTPTPQPQSPQTAIGYAFDPATFVPAFPTPDVDRNHLEIDPIIRRMANLIEEF